MKYKVILFDADGVTLKEGQRFSEFYAEKYNIPLAELTPFFTGPFQECLIGKSDAKEELSNVISDWGWKGTIDALMELWFSSSFELNDKVVKVIKRLCASGVLCFLVTNQEKYRGQYLREKLQDIFNGVFVSGDIGYKKDQVEFFEHVFSCIQQPIDKADILLVDDDIENVETAQRFGIKAIHYRGINDLLRIN